MQVIVSLIENAKKPFFVSADLRPIHFGIVSNQLDLVEDCLRKICLLIKRAIPLLEPDLVNHVTMEADNLIKEKENIARSLVEEKKKYDSKNSNRIKVSIKNQLVGFEKKLNEFFKSLAEEN